MKRSIYYALKGGGLKLATALADGEKFFTFKCNGGEFRLFKRVDSADAHYYFRFKRAGRSLSPCLGTNNRDVAVRLALAEVQRVEDALTLRRFGHASLPAHERRAALRTCTLKELFAAWHELTLGEKLARKTVQTCETSLRVIIRQGLGDPTLRVNMHPSREEIARLCAALDPMSLDVIGGANGGKMVRAFQRARLAAVPAHDQQALQRALATLNATLLKARMMFTEQRQKALRLDYGLTLPDLTEFLHEATDQPTTQMKTRPPRELLVKTFAAADALWRRDPNAYIVWRLACYSLRRGDISRACRDWIKFVDDYDDLDFTKQTVQRWVIEWPMRKGSRMNRVVIPDEEAALFIAHWEAEQTRTLDGRPVRREWERPYLVTAGVNSRRDAELRCHQLIHRVSEWMRALGWTTTHTLHEMRAFHLRMARAQYGAAAAAGLKHAAEVGGHRDTHTTEQHYTGAMSVANDNVVIRLPGIKVA